MESYLANSTPLFRGHHFDRLHTRIDTRNAFLGLGHRVNDQLVDVDTTLR